LNLIETAKEWGIRPASLLLHSDPRGKWDEWDFLCVEAHKGVLNERCPHCGMPVWVCRNEDADIGFKIVEDTCFALRELETIDEAKSSKKNYKAPKGAKARPEAYRYSNSEVFTGEMREAYYKAKWEQDNPES